MKKTLESALIAAVDGLRTSSPEEMTGLLKELQVTDEPTSSEFWSNVEKAHAKLMDEVYSNIIRAATRSYLSDGTLARCPKCSSVRVHEGDSLYEFTQMICDECGYTDVADEYELVDWYPKS